MLKGTIIKGIGGFYYVDTEKEFMNVVQEEYFAKRD